MAESSPVNFRQTLVKLSQDESLPREDRLFFSITKRAVDEDWDVNTYKLRICEHGLEPLVNKHAGFLSGAGKAIRKLWGGAKGLTKKLFGKTPKPKTPKPKAKITSVIKPEDAAQGAKKTFPRMPKNVKEYNYPHYFGKKIKTNKPVRTPEDVGGTIANIKNRPDADTFKIGSDQASSQWPIEYLRDLHKKQQESKNIDEKTKTANLLVKRAIDEDWDIESYIARGQELGFEKQALFKTLGKALKAGWGGLKKLKSHVLWPTNTSGKAMAFENPVEWAANMPWRATVAAGGAAAKGAGKAGAGIAKGVAKGVGYPAQKAYDFMARKFSEDPIGMGFGTIFSIPIVSNYGSKVLSAGSGDFSG